MTEEEYNIMMIRQQEIYNHRIWELEAQKKEIDNYLDKLSNAEYSRLKRIVDNDNKTYNGNKVCCNNK